jgi:hypothetical protein
MTTTINASTSAGLVQTADTSGSLALQTASTTALTLDTSQNATFAGSVKTNTLTSAASTALTLQSAGATAVTIDTSQKVGIGTSSPNANLQVNGGIQVTGTPTIGSTGVGVEIGYGLVNASEGAIQAYNRSGSAWINMDYSALAHKFLANNSEAMRIDSSGNVGIGTSSPSTYVNGYNKSLVVGDGTNWATIQGRTDGPSGAANGVSYGGSYSTNPINGARMFIGATSAGQRGIITFNTKDLDDNTTQPLERMRILSNGDVLIGATTGNPLDGGQLQVTQSDDNCAVFKTTSSNYQIICQGGQGSNTGNQILFRYGNNAIGSIQSTSSATAYNTSSDYRLKENIAPMTGALSKVAQLKPVTYKWKLDGSDGQGFIAHELQEIVPDCVTGEKDAVDAKGNPKYQGIDVSFLVATLTAAIQELKAINDTQAETINALTARIVALEK